MEKSLRDELIRQALAAKEFAYAPYSGYRVGAAVLGKGGKIYRGCNIENASYGLTNCAERSALFNAISEGERTFVGLAVAVDGKLPASPCGACRQVIREFFADDTEIFLVNEEGEARTTTIKELLPGAFTDDYM
ncbi:MAG: cytidine deaminase [Bacillota bacterium]